MHTESFFDASVQVRQFLALGPSHDTRLPIFDISVPHRFVDFCHELLEVCRVFKEVVEYCGEGDGGCFGSGEGHADCHDKDAVVGEEVGAVFFGFEEHGEEVAAGNRGGFFRVRGEAFGHAGFGEFYDGEGGGHYAVVVEGAEDGVLEE